MKPTKIYPVVVPPGGAFQLLATGDYFKVLSSSADIEVRGDTFGTIGVIKAGQGLRNTPFQRLEFRDTSGFQNTLQVIVGDSDFVDDRVAGEVSVIDGGKARTLAGSAFSGFVIQPAVATQNSRVQLWNPAGSGKRAVIEQLLVASSAASTLTMIPVAVALATLSGNPASKNVGGVASVMELRTASTAGGAVPPYLGAFQLAATTTYSYKLAEPIVLAPGTGLLVLGSTVSADVLATFEYFEELI